MVDAEENDLNNDETKDAGKMRGWEFCAMRRKSLIDADGHHSGQYMCGGGDDRDPDDYETWLCEECHAKGMKE
jgi:hypothetical protein